MALRRLHWVVLFVLVVPLAAVAGKPKPCITADEATKLLNKDVCVSAHVYDVVQLPDGTRYLDVCSPETTDEACRFTIISLWEDHDEVGELMKYRDMNVQVRGIVQPNDAETTRKISVAPRPMLRLERSEMAPMIWAKTCRRSSE
jgi:hypothetical protein